MLKSARLRNALLAIIGGIGVCIGVFWLLNALYGPGHSNASLLDLTLAPVILLTGIVVMAIGVTSLLYTGDYNPENESES